MILSQLFYPQIEVQLGSYTFTEGIELETASAKDTPFDWAKIHFTQQLQDNVQIAKGDEARVLLGYDGNLEEVLVGYVAKSYPAADGANDLLIKDEMLRIEETVIHDTFLDVTPQDLISYLLSQAGITQARLTDQLFPPRRRFPVQRQNGLQLLGSINTAWGLRLPYYFSGGVFYWGVTPSQSKVYHFEYGVNIMSLQRSGGVWELETVSAPFVKHSHVIQITHPLLTGEVEVTKVVSRTNDAGFLRTVIYF